jgi:transmembrane sensor
MHLMEKFNSRSEILRMIRRYVAGTANKEEEKFLEAYYENFEGEEDIFQGMADLEKQNLEADLYRVLSAGPADEVSVKPLWFSLQSILSAAVIVIIFAAGLYFYSDRSENQQQIAISKPKPVINDVPPGGNIAVLTLADGTKINLDEAANGKIANQAGWNISKKEGSQLVYSLVASTDQPEDAKNLFNIVETPRGGEYQVILPDGTLVWLNAASSLRYPAVFTGHERRVELQGEAYFEVAHNEKMPFRVESNRQLVEVLGTHFNINGYADDRVVRTTLLEGSVKVSAGNHVSPRNLKPGQQAIVGQSGASISVRGVDAEESIAWKNGYFLFNNENIHSIMRKISRWYNVDVEYNGKTPSGGFGGNVSKSKNISEVLRILELTKAVHFKVQGRRVTVMP